MKRWLISVLLSATIGLTTASWATDSTAVSPDPVKDCPKTLVCFTEPEAKQIALTRVNLEAEVQELRAKRPKLIAPFYNVGFSWLPTATDRSFGGYADGGLRIGPVSVGAGVHDYGYGVGTHLTANFHKEF